jgi:biopolymer transport protein TolQ
VNDPAASLSIVKLFINADPVVKGVLLLLLAASVWSWAVIIDKLWRLGAASRSAREHEARAAAARSPQELAAIEGRRQALDPASHVLSAGFAESTAEPAPQPETPGERRERIERAMQRSDRGGAADALGLSDIIRPAVGNGGRQERGSSTGALTI